MENNEWLTSFRTLGDVPNKQATMFEIQTNKRTYPVIWGYEIKTNADDGVEYRQYNYSVREFCKSLDISTLDYGFTKMAGYKYV